MTRLTLSALILTCSTTVQAIPPVEKWIDFPVSYAPDAPGAFSADGLLDKPAGRLGPVVVKDGHFYTGDKRIRFWGVNICFSGCFPTHEQAERVAARLARFGVNCVRFHHMDNARFPRGIFADDKLETLSPEALDRLDYFIAQLKKNGIYANLNLHVSRTWSKPHGWENADKLPQSFDKYLDIFHPDLIKANKQYATDLLTHVNKYTGNPYAKEPAVAMVEINNEDTLFLWGGEQALAKLPEPYAGMLNKLWNQWLVKKHGSREQLGAVWNVGASPLGQNLLTGKWNVEAHNGAKMTAKLADQVHSLDISKLSGTDWHAQYSCAGLKVKKGQFYTLTFTVSASAERRISVGVAQAHDPWNNLGFSSNFTISPKESQQRFGFVATADDDNGRVSFSVGQAVGQVTLSNVQFREGGQVGLDENEDPFSNKPVASHAPGAPTTAPRKADWFDFLQQTDEAYFVGMKDFLRNELKVVAPITGTIGLGPLGTLSQSKMDFIDGHSYWEHPHFPGRPWDPKNWVINNKPMVDNPKGATLWGLAALRVKGMPFTVTEYNHSAPNEWQAECIPMIATYAALQDWDGIFLFSYLHSDRYEPDRMSSYFDIEGNPLKMCMMPLGARIFLGAAVAPAASERTFVLEKSDMLKHASASYNDVERFIDLMHKYNWLDTLSQRVSISYGPLNEGAKPEGRASPGATWEKLAAGQASYAVSGDRAVSFVGLSAAKGPGPIKSIESPFASMILVSAHPSKPLAQADRLLLCALARGQNTGMKWNDARTTVSDQWGKAPFQAEVVKATLTLPADYTVRPLDPSGKPLREFNTTNKTLKLGEDPTVWYELLRK